jgi:hypothetical protein
MSKLLIALFVLLGPQYAWAEGPARAEPTPYYEGIIDYNSGLCYRARPDYEGQKMVEWELGFRYAQEGDHDQMDRSYCFPRSSSRD